MPKKLPVESTPSRVQPGRSCKVSKSEDYWDSVLGEPGTSRKVRKERSLTPEKGAARDAAEAPEAYQYKVRLVEESFTKLRGKDEEIRNLREQMISDDDMAKMIGEIEKLEGPPGEGETPEDVEIRKKEAEKLQIGLKKSYDKNEEIEKQISHIIDEKESIKEELSYKCLIAIGDKSNLSLKDLTGMDRVRRARTRRTSPFHRIGEMTVVEERVIRKMKGEMMMRRRAVRREGKRREKNSGKRISIPFRKS